MRLWIWNRQRFTMQKMGFRHVNQSAGQQASRVRKIITASDSTGEIENFSMNAIGIDFVHCFVS